MDNDHLNLRAVTYPSPPIQLPAMWNINNTLYILSGTHFFYKIEFKKKKKKIDSSRRRHKKFTSDLHIQTRAHVYSLSCTCAHIHTYTQSCTHTIIGTLVHMHTYLKGDSPQHGWTQKKPVFNKKEEERRYTIPLHEGTESWWSHGDME